MTPKEILIQTLKHQETEQVAWVRYRLFLQFSLQL